MSNHETYQPPHQRYSAVGGGPNKSDTSGANMGSGYQGRGRGVPPSDASGANTGSGYQGRGRGVPPSDASGAYTGLGYQGRGRGVPPSDTSRSNTGSGYQGRGRGVPSSDTSQPNTGSGYQGRGRGVPSSSTSWLITGSGYRGRGWGWGSQPSDTSSSGTSTGSEYHGRGRGSQSSETGRSRAGSGYQGRGRGFPSSGENTGPGQGRGRGFPSSGENTGPGQGRGRGSPSSGQYTGPGQGRGRGFPSSGENTGPGQGRGRGVPSAETSQSNTGSGQGRGRGSPSADANTGSGYQARKTSVNHGNYIGWKKVSLDDRKPFTKEDYPKGPVLETLDYEQIELESVEKGSEEEKLTKHDYELLASYNWLPKDEWVKEGDAFIVVPGLPPRWTPPPLPAWLTQDEGTFFIDQNGYRSPHCPFEPALRALFTLRPDFDPTPLDLITDRNNLRKLFRYACGEKKFIHDFKLYVEVVNKTLVFTRWEKETLNVVPPGMFRGFGHAFEATFTKYTTGLVGSSGHSRLARYRFGGLNIMVRFSADAFLGSKDIPLEDYLSNGKASTTSVSDKVDTPPLSKAPTPNSPPVIAPRPAPKKANPDDLIDLFGNSLKIKGESIDANKGVRRFEYEIIPGGLLMPQERVLEIKTRAATRPIELLDQIPQSWFSNTCNLYVGYHERGSFSYVDTQVMNANDLENWEVNSQGDLKKMKILLERIVNIMRGVKGGRAVIACIDGKLRICGIGHGEGEIGKLPTELRKKWGVE